MFSVYHRRTALGLFCFFSFLTCSHGLSQSPTDFMSFYLPMFVWFFYPVKMSSVYICVSQFVLHERLVLPEERWVETDRKLPWVISMWLFLQELKYVYFHRKQDASFSFTCTALLLASQHHIISLITIGKKKKRSGSLAPCHTPPMWNDCSDTLSDAWLWETKATSSFLISCAGAMMERCSPWSQQYTHP